MKYFAFCDPSGGAVDSYVLAIARTSMITKKAILVGFWERKAPLNPDITTAEFAAILKDYELTTVTGDRYSAQWVVERFRSHGITYLVSERSKSEIFLEFLALANSGRVKIPHDKRLRAQFASLERKTSRSGADSVDHPASSHDDAANSVAGSLVLAAGALTARAKKFDPPFLLNCDPRVPGAPKRIPESQWPRYGPLTAEDLDPANSTGFGRPRSGGGGPSFGPGRR
jgi:hypothetical protein